MTPWLDRTRPITNAGLVAIVLLTLTLLFDLGALSGLLIVVGWSLVVRGALQRYAATMKDDDRG